jgi:hypothetical protein
MSKADLNSNTSMTPLQYVRSMLGISMTEWKQLSEDERDSLRTDAMREMKARGIEVRP